MVVEYRMFWLSGICSEVGCYSGIRGDGSDCLLCGGTGEMFRWTVVTNPDQVRRILSQSDV